MRIALLLTLAACNKDAPGEWTFVAQDLDAGLLSITGTSSTDVWTVGADAGSGPLVAHYDGAAWSTIDTGTVGDLWWVHLDGDTAWFVGAGGRVLDYTGGTTTEAVTDADATLFGIWGTSADLWAVGGDLVGSTPALWRRQGGTWAEVALPAEAADVRGLFKVWGTSASDVWIVGTGGAILHFDGAELALVTSPSPSNLFTVHGTGASEAFAVGGDGSAVALHWNGTAWSNESPTFTPQLNGVFARGDDVAAVGATGAVYRRVDGVWTEDERGSASFDDFHAAFIDDTGALWAVGGSIASAPLDAGMILYDGEAEIPALAP